MPESLPESGHGDGVAPTFTVVWHVRIECMCGAHFQTFESHALHACEEIRKADKDVLVATYNAHKVLKLVA